jgi:hypothetical protein
MHGKMSCFNNSTACLFFLDFDLRGDCMGYDFDVSLLAVECSPAHATQQSVAMLHEAQLVTKFQFVNVYNRSVSWTVTAACAAPIV